jgi:alcohol sulfotransferase
LAHARHAGAGLLIAERKLRGVEQFDKLQNADIVIVSAGKSDRTWLRVMVSYPFRVMYGLPANAILGFERSAIPLRSG